MIVNVSRGARVLVHLFFNRLAARIGMRFSGRL